MLNTFERKSWEQYMAQYKRGEAGTPVGIINCKPYITI
jgi:hypothetical protein